MDTERPSILAAIFPHKQGNKKTKGRRLFHQRIMEHNKPSTVTYCSTAVQTLPPANAEVFRQIYGRDATEQDLVTRVGTAAIGRYVAGSASTPYDTIIGTPFQVEHNDPNKTDHSDASFQIQSVSATRVAIVRAIGEATRLVKKQRLNARSVGLEMWPERKIRMIAHTEQWPIDLVLDEEGNVTNRKSPHGVFLPNVCCREIDTTPGPSESHGKAPNSSSAGQGERHGSHLKRILASAPRDASKSSLANEAQVERAHEAHKSRKRRREETKHRAQPTEPLQAPQRIIKNPSTERRHQEAAEPSTARNEQAAPRTADKPRAKEPQQDASTVFREGEPYRQQVAQPTVASSSSAAASGIELPEHRGSEAPRQQQQRGADKQDEQEDTDKAASRANKRAKKTPREEIKRYVPKKTSSFKR